MTSERITVMPDNLEFIQYLVTKYHEPNLFAVTPKYGDSIWNLFAAIDNMLPPTPSTVGWWTRMFLDDKIDVRTYINIPSLNNEAPTVGRESLLYDYCQDDDDDERRLATDQVLKKLVTQRRHPPNSMTFQATLTYLDNIARNPTLSTKCRQLFEKATKYMRNVAVVAASTV